ncbi:hypothetical protein [Streptomyces sp. GS7]|uniref:hypothetical protein n=1 Tax=Streptomyces sp. GS7 TaxID=2692234 RepID=UPI00131658A3|nr:hypothetical protein [Streptomyces sp. GS7]QHC23529.1 hypothetical protein GR130_21305 [Streptomyces sp. GS7]
MTKLLLALHVLAAIIAVGPVTVAASMFPTALRRAAADGDVGGTVTVALLHRICRVYAHIGIAVPVFGFAVASELHVLGSPWLITSIALTAAAAVVLGLLVLPRQQAALAALEDRLGEAVVEGSAAARLAVFTGIFNLLWATVTVLMIVRPGSTTGV